MGTVQIRDLHIDAESSLAWVIMRRNEKPRCKSEGKCQFFVDLVLSLILVRACFSFCALEFS